MFTFVDRPCPVPQSRLEFHTRTPPFPLTVARMEFDGLEGPEDPVDNPADTGDNLGEATSKLIPHPRGEPGRPNSGGFNLGVELNKYGWSKDSFTKMTEAVDAMAREKLDFTKSYSKQDKKAIQEICTKESAGTDVVWEMKKDKNWATLKNYEKCWPVICILKSKLKNGVAAARRNEVKDMQVRMQAIMNRRGMSPAV
ncbi:hypothetical protein H0H93_015600 [Arthromyces matolae]|nr:hypothetical protein H0H93_015600 [Arthromyces matolae]